MLVLVKVDKNPVGVDKLRPRKYLEIYRGMSIYHKCDLIFRLEILEWE